VVFDFIAINVFIWVLSVAGLQNTFQQTDVVKTAKAPGYCKTGCNVTLQPVVAVCKQDSVICHWQTIVIYLGRLSPTGSSSLPTGIKRATYWT